ncbi:MAG: YbjN domain-containing protein [Lewinella sp.]|nr:YbjN domain-containing protein [Lewinella sp.]
MRKNWKVLFPAAMLATICWLGAPTAVQAQDMDSTEKELQTMYMVYLEENDYSPMVDQDGDVQFRYNNMMYFIDVDASDTEYFAVMLPNSWEIESEEEGKQALQACNAVNASTKVVKAQVINENVWFTTEIILPEPGNFRTVFPRLLEAIDSAVDRFVEEMTAPAGKY